MDAHQSPQLFHPTNPKEIMSSHLPEVTSTSIERLHALKEAKALLFVPAAESKGLFSQSTGGGSAPQTPDLFRVAEYITTGHDYLDTHPKGKRRPIIQNVTVHAVGMPQGVAEQLLDDKFLDHLLSHAAEGKPVDDEPEHQPQAEGDRPRFS